MMVLAAILSLLACEKNNTEHQDQSNLLQIQSSRVGKTDLQVGEITSQAPVDQPIVITFSQPIDTTTVTDHIELLSEDSTHLGLSLYYLDQQQTLSIRPDQNLSFNTGYHLKIASGIQSQKGASFPGIEYRFKTRGGTLRIKSATINGKELNASERTTKIDFNTKIKVNFNAPLQKEGISNQVILSGSQGEVPVSLSYVRGDSTLVVQNQEPLDYYRKYRFKLTSELTSANDFQFEGFSNAFYTRLDSTDKFPRISDAELLTKIQEQTFKYFWDFGHPDSGLTRERNTSGNTVTIGGSGFGIMSIIVGIERGFITREQGLQRMQKILDFLENDADRFHGAWPHWLNGSTGQVTSFSEKDDGADLVETAFLVQGLLTFREYLDPSIPQEQNMMEQINRLWEGVEWDWFTQGEDVLYWHWSPNYGFEMDLPIRGHNETQIVYVLAAASPTHPIEASTYHNGYAQNGDIQNGNQFYGYTLPLGHELGGPLFFAHYSYLGMDPRNLEDQYANYWRQNKNHSLINQAYCVDNPNDFVGYGKNSWGLTASDNHQGYNAHSPTNDLGVITPTAAISSIPYTPEKSMNAIRHFYYKLGDRLWGPYGFYDAFNVTENWWADSYLAIDQGPIILMIENHRTGLLWNLFMSAPEVQEGLEKLGFSY
jgi:hypothetical protein